ncbi:AAA family ATPase [Bradyrhizobium sp. WSM1253]|uniref:AAA family ATPase n=1 Tax=Bradyrhizobium sp. WSM1253 TaxID=319003 RepID=UPI00025D25E7|nr:AAA family ATPase [Bradyrhizobium sp. WSM1253]EIG62309.1 hypothetical protein Bra1253DRAFT_07224 [Bradyrhizobium sp. WSM1253]
MQLKWFHVRDFQSVRDSGRIPVSEITCLVGKNEAGKSALLKALYRLNPVVPADGNFDVTNDYPRMDVEDYRHAVESGKRGTAVPITACYALDADEIAAIADMFGEACVTKPEITFEKSYDNKRTYSLSADTSNGLEHLISKADLSEQAGAALTDAPRTADGLSAILQAQEQTAEVTRLLAVLAEVKKSGISGYIYTHILLSRRPKYLYFDEYYQMTGHENIEALVAREAANPSQLKPSDHPLLGLIRLARLKLPELINPASTIELKNRLEGASNHLTRQVLKYWSQNKHLRMTFDVSGAEGTRVLEDVFAASADSLFPLQGALGYELHQTLFVGPYSLVVEGAADLLFLQAMSAILQEDKRTGLDPRWTITPVGGAAKVPTFVALLGAQKRMVIATLIDSQSADQQKIEGLYREKLLRKANVLTFAHFTKTSEADIEDMFGPEFYVGLVNAEFSAQLSGEIDAKALKSKEPRILQRLERYFVEHPLKDGTFSHYRPARYFNENSRKLSSTLPKGAKDRFEAAFKTLNALIPS